MPVTVNEDKQWNIIGDSFEVIRERSKERTLTEYIHSLKNKS